MMKEHETNQTDVGLPRALANPVTGEKVTFPATAEETGGECFEVVEGRLDSRQVPVAGRVFGNYQRNEARVKKGMSRMIEVRKTIGLLAMLMGALLALSVLAASDADAKKTKKDKPRFNVVKCEAPADNSYSTICEGTDKKDHLVGTNSEFPDFLRGEKGTDVYDGRGGGHDGSGYGDVFEDRSETSSDYYKIGKNLKKDGGVKSVFDNGGPGDVAKLKPFSTDDIKEVLFVDRSVGGVEITLDLGNGDVASVFIFEQNFDEDDELESYVFADDTLTADEIKDLASSRR